MKRIVSFVIAAGLLTGCGANYDASPAAYDLAQRQMDAQARCEAAYAASMKTDCFGISERDCLMLKMQAENVKLIAVATGRNPSPCGGTTNLFDVMRTEVTEKNATARIGIGSTAGVVKFGLGVWGATEVVDSMGKNAGSNTTQNTGGGDASVTNNRTNTEIKNDAQNFGEEGTATTGGETPIGAAPAEVPAGTEVVGEMEVTTD